MNTYSTKLLISAKLTGDSNASMMIDDSGLDLDNRNGKVDAIFEFTLNGCNYFIVLPAGKHAKMEKMESGKYNIRYIA